MLYEGFNTVLIIANFVIWGCVLAEWLAQCGAA